MTNPTERPEGLRITDHAWISDAMDGGLCAKCGNKRERHGKKVQVGSLTGNAVRGYIRWHGDKRVAVTW